MRRLGPGGRQGAVGRMAAMAMVVALAGLPVLPAQAGEVSVGAPLPPLPPRDQHDAPAPATAGVALVLFSRDMDAGNLVKEELATDGATRLAAAGAVVVSDLSGMPGLVTKMFALPALRRRGYPVLLDLEGLATRDFPARPGQVTMIRVRDGQVSGVSYAASRAEVAAGLTAP